MKVFYFAAARAASGLAQEELVLAEVTGSTTAPLAKVVDYLAGSHTGRTPSGLTLAQVLKQCSFLINGSAASLESQLSEADRLDVLPPFAGG
ncbi:MAG: MoaD/ThiS family protein [Rothia sp. (in: high G+C Gram-positive bacteria)]|nr:MoaD/ThiS family protein [Rothia sp. (in: high G+C Gram-positive bacteria)]